ncbi:ComEC/Rec2 family competence protein [Clostridium manihotivorum]|nr:MBL fold metallo-hydrolase [Clostridium manihotivorum]
MEIFLEKAFNGECIRIRYGEKTKTNIIIDSGTGIFAKTFKKLIDKIIQNNEVIDLLILTHIDDDHINGFRRSISNINGKYIKKIWLNGEPIQYYNNQTHSPKNIGGLVETIRTKGINLITPILGGTMERIGEADLTVLTPRYEDMINVSRKIERLTPHGECNKYSLSFDELSIIDEYKPDNSNTNKASISFIFSYEYKNIAFLGDAHAEDIIYGLSRYWNGKPIDIVKLSHHGSKYNVNDKLLSMLGSHKFIISKKSAVHKETIGRLLSYGESVEIYCNYKWWTSVRFFTVQDKSKYLDTNKLKMFVIGQDGIVIE